MKTSIKKSLFESREVIELEQRMLCSDFFSTLNKNRKLNEISKDFNIPYPTLNKWSKSLLSIGSKEKVGNLFIEYLNRVNMEQTLNIMKKYDLPKNNILETVGSILDIEKGNNNYEYLKSTKIFWKQKIFYFFLYELNRELFLMQFKNIENIIEYKEDQLWHTEN